MTEGASDGAGASCLGVDTTGELVTIAAVDSLAGGSGVLAMSAVA